MPSRDISQVAQEVSRKLEFSWSYFQTIKNEIAKDLSDLQFLYFLGRAARLRLMPGEEVVAFPSQRGLRIQITTEGWFALARRDPDYGEVRSAPVYEGEKCIINYVTGEVHHEAHLPPPPGAKPVGAWAQAVNKSGRRFAVFTPFQQFCKPDSAAWQNYPADMICRKAETRVIKIAYETARIAPTEEAEMAATEPPAVGPEEAKDVNGEVIETEKTNSHPEPADRPEKTVQAEAADPEFDAAVPPRKRRTNGLRDLLRDVHTEVTRRGFHMPFEHFCKEIVPKYVQMYIGIAKPERKYSAEEQDRIAAVLRERGIEQVAREMIGEEQQDEADLLSPGLRT